MESESICARCVLPNSTPGIEFDGDGICNYCSAYVPMKVAGEEKLVGLLDTVRGRGEEYDCMVCISGGRDSVYALWKLVRVYNMRVLACNYLNPFTAEQARTNIQNSLSILKVDCVKWGFPGDVHRQATARALRVWSRRPSSIMIPFVCAHCKFTWPTFCRIARDNHIALIIIGSNPLETASFKQVGLGGARTYHRMSNLPQLMARSLRELLLNPYYLTGCSGKTVGKMYLMAGHSAPYVRWRWRNITVLRLFDYVRWDEQKVMSTITDRLGWRKSSEVASPWRFDCRLDYVRRLMYAATIGVTELRDLFSKMIREGQLTREEALERLRVEDVVPEEVAQDVLADLGLSLSDLHLGLA